MPRKEDRPFVWAIRARLDVSNFAPAEAKIVSYDNWSSLHLSAVVPCIRQIIHEHGIFAPVIDARGILPCQSARFLFNAHIVDSGLEGRRLWDSFESFGVFGTHQFRLFLEALEFLQGRETFWISLGLKNFCSPFIVLILAFAIEFFRYIHRDTPDFF